MRLDKRFCLLVILCLFFIMAGCDTASEPSSTPPSHTYIFTQADLLAVKDAPEQTYHLMQDIDLSGADWSGIPCFSGTFRGNGHTISNINLTASDGAENLGFFSAITDQGTVEELHLSNVTVDASGSNAKNIGILAGTNEGTILHCTATGLITDTRETELHIGALVGRTNSGSTVIGGTSLYVTDDALVHTTTGLAADVKLYVADCPSVTRGLVGYAAPGSQVSGLWRDHFYSSERNSAIIQERQDTAVSYMHAMGTVEWTVPEAISFMGRSENSVHTQHFNPGITYTGIPYAERMGMLERFMYCMDEHNQLNDWAMETYGDVKTTTTGTGFSTYMGTDCVGALDWAWMRISPVIPWQGGAFPTVPKNLFPVASIQRQYGIYPVGQKQGDRFDGEDAAYETDGLPELSSVAVLEKNGEGVLLEAYAMSRKADALLASNSHLRLLATDPVVIRNANGTIDPEQSYMITIEQGDGLYNRKYANALSSWRVHYRYTFQLLIYGSTKEAVGERMVEQGCIGPYIPITIRVLREDTVYPPEIQTYPAPDTFPITSPEHGTYSSNYRIISSRVLIRDTAGQVVTDRIFFLEGRDQYMNTVDCGTLHKAVCQDLTPGTYTFTIQATLSDGSVHTVVEDVSFTR